MVFVYLFARMDLDSSSSSDDTVAYESRKKMADSVRGPRLGFVAETGRFVAMETP